ncbi:MAG: ABC transporter ATP-binding protein [Candidatus Omnitrophota bacterium]|nr:ABC transporter ATP-binding protein [Candidatus Omnitrophota bacterium]
MTDNTAIRVEGLSKIYRLYDKPIDRLKEALHIFRRKYHRDFFALQDVSFEIRKGESIGIIGRNGAGKSTLLKILTGVLTASSGRVDVTGKVSALLELGLGFNPEMTGIENVRFGGAIMGYSKEAFEAKIDEILSFADIGEFVHQPVKTYSSGMYVRLAFALQMSVDPDILIVDEALAVGDVFFQAKCMTRLRHIIDKGVTVLFVSHDTSVVKSLCSKALLLDRGRLLTFDRPGAVAETYFRMKTQAEQPILSQLAGEPRKFVPTGEATGDELWDSFTAATQPFEERARYERISNGKASFRKVAILDAAGQEIEEANFGQEITLRMAVEAHEDVPQLGYSYCIADRNMHRIIYSDSYIENGSLENVRAGERFIVDWNFKLPLQAGSYNVLAALSIPVNLELQKVVFCDRIPIACQFLLNRDPAFHLYAPVKFEHRLRIQRMTAQAATAGN